MNENGMIVLGVVMILLGIGGILFLKYKEKELMKKQH